MATTEFMIGKRERITIVTETSYGSGGTMTSGYLPGYDVSIEPDFSQGWQEILSAGTDTRNITDQVTGPLSLSFTMNYLVGDFRILKYMLDYTNTGGPTTYTHSMTLGNTVNSFKMEWARRHTTNQVYTITGSVPTSLTFSFSKASGEGNEGFIKASAKCIAKNISIGSSVSTVSAYSRTPFMFKGAYLLINNVEVAELNNGEITIDNGIDEADSRYCNVTNSNLIGDPIPKIFRISGRFNINMKDNSFDTLWNNATSVSNCSLAFIQTTNTNDITFTFTGFRVKSSIAPTNIEGVTNIDLVWDCNSVAVSARDNLSW